MKYPNKIDRNQREYAIDENSEIYGDTAERDKESTDEITLSSSSVVSSLQKKKIVSSSIVLYFEGNAS